jgi:hypothetical protein
MNWEAIGAVGEVVGALVVLISVVYLALQVKHANEQVQQANLQAQTTANAEWFYSWNETIKGWAKDPATVEAMRMGFDDLRTLTDLQKAVFTTQLGATANHWELARELAERGMLSEHLYNHITNIMVSIFSTPGAKDYLEMVAPGLPNGPELLSKVTSGDPSIPPWTAVAPWWSAGSSQSTE